MNKPKHTKEPWHVIPVGEKRGVIATDADATHWNVYAANAYVCQVKRSGVREIQQADAARIVSCVNACAGIANPQEWMKKATETIDLLDRMAGMVADCGYGGSNGATECSHVKQAEKLRAALAALKGE